MNIVSTDDSLRLPIFAEFGLWRGYAPANFDVNFLGQRTDVSFNTGWSDAERACDRQAQPPYPQLSDETFEWIALFKAILEADRVFTMIDLGAGYGRWLVAAACAVCRRRPELKLRLVGVEPDPTHFRWLIKHFKDNDINDQHHHLIEGAVGIEDGEAFLSMAVDPAADYGQRVFASVEEANRHGIANTIPVRTYALSTLLSRFDVVDLVDMDIQGTELEVVSAAHDQLTSKVKRINVGTHSHDIEKGLRKLLGISGWHCEADYSCLGNRRTPYGEITFGDGTQTWVNPKFSESHP